MTHNESGSGEALFRFEEAAVEKFLDSLSDEETRQEARELIQQLSRVEEGVSFQITFPEQRNFSELELDFNALKSTREGDVEEIRRLVVELSVLCKQYLRRPMITDTLSSHKARRGLFGKSFDRELQKRYIPYHQANKLRYNNIGGIQEKLKYLHMLLSGKTGIPRIDEKIATSGRAPRVEWDKKDAVLAVLDSFPDMKDYGELDGNLEEKVKRIAQIDAFCESFLTLFSKQEP